MSKSKDPNYIMVSGNIPVELYKKAKHFLVENAEQYPHMGDLLEAALREFLRDKQISFGERGDEC